MYSRFFLHFVVAVLVLVAAHSLADASGAGLGGPDVDLSNAAADLSDAGAGLSGAAADLSEPAADLSPPGAGLSDPAAPVEPEVAPELVRFVEAAYPTDALRSGREGAVVLELLVNASGGVDSTTLMTPCGWAPTAGSGATTRSARPTAPTSTGCSGRPAPGRPRRPGSRWR